MTKHEKLLQMIKDIETEDLPEGHSVVYLEDDVMDLVSNVKNAEQAGDTVNGLLEIASTIAADIATHAVEEASVAEIIQSFVEIFKGNLVLAISENEELFLRYVQEAKDLIDKEEDENKDINDRVLH